jgi:hypothetical protein
MSNKDDEEKFEGDLNLMMKDVDSNSAMVVFKNPYKKARTEASSQTQQQSQALMVTPQKASRATKKSTPAPVTPEKNPQVFSKKSAHGRGMDAIIVSTQVLTGGEDPKDQKLVALIMERGITSISRHAEEYKDSNTWDSRRASLPDSTVPTTSDDGDEFAGIENVVVTASHGYNEICREAGIAESLRNINVTEVIGLGSYFNDQTGKIINNAYGDMVFSAVPSIKQTGQTKISPNFNKLLEPEFLQGPNGSQEFNLAFWRNQMSYYTQKNETGHTCQKNFLELSIKMASYLMTDETKERHEAVLQTLQDEESPLNLGGEWLKMTLYDKYAWVFVNMMNSPLTIAARKAGYRPVFLMKNTIKQCTGTINTIRNQFASCDSRAKSSIILVGYVKVNGNTAKKVIGLKAGTTFPFIKKGHASGGV